MCQIRGAFQLSALKKGLLLTLSAAVTRANVFVPTCCSWCGHQTIYSQSAKQAILAHVSMNHHLAPVTLSVCSKAYGQSQFIA
jgi:hypothetical protein